MNERAWALADRYVARAYDLRMGVRTLSSGARVIDAGVEVPGGLEAGLMLAELCMGGLGHVSYAPIVFAGESWTGVQVWTDHPAASCMASQYAGWAINPDGFFAMGSGPLRAKARVEKELFEKLGYAEQASRGVLVLEGACAADRRRRGVGREESGCHTARHYVRRRADGEPGGRGSDRRALDRNRTAQDGHARF